MSSPSQAIIDLDAILANLAAIRERVGDRAVMMAIKANAYGHGAPAVAQAVQTTGAADMFAVATVDEGLQLRQAGITLPILKLSPCMADELAQAFAADLCVTVVDEATIDQAATAQGTVPGGTGRVHLKVDTGMGRIGCRPEQAVALAQRIDAAGLVLEGIFTHLPSSDLGDDQGRTDAELAGFRATVAQVEAVRGPVRWTHAANSGAILGHDLAGFNLVRPGIIAYGYYPDATSPHTLPLRPALRWTTRISFLKQVQPGDTVSYGRTWVAPRTTWIATVPVGYGDGYSRLESNRGSMLVGGRAVPVVGRVCMDQTMLDLGPDLGATQVGDEVVILGRDGDTTITADDLAADAGTISYEVLCQISSRVIRRHVARDTAQ